MLVCIYGFLFVCLPKPGTQTQRSVRSEFPSGKMHLSILTSVFYMNLPIPTSLFLLTLTSPGWSTATSTRGSHSSPGVFSSYMFSQTRAAAQAYKHHKTTSYQTKPGAQSELGAPAAPPPPSHKAAFRCAGAGALLLLCLLFKVNELGSGISLAEAAGGRACNLQYVRLRSRCDGGRRGAAA